MIHERQWRRTMGVERKVAGRQSCDFQWWFRGMKAILENVLIAHPQQRQHNFISKVLIFNYVTLRFRRKNR